MKNKVIHIKDAPPDFRTNPNFVYIGRANYKNGLEASKWGNPYKADNAPTHFRTEDERRAWAINAYHSRLMMTEELHWDLPELAGKTFICYCHPKKCHGDVLACWWNILHSRRHKFRALHPSYVSRRVLIAGSRLPVSNEMIQATRRLVVEAFSREDELLIGDAVGIDAIAADWAERLMMPYTVFGISESPRGFQTDRYFQVSRAALDAQGKEGSVYTQRDRFMLSYANAVYCVWNGRSAGTKAVFELAKSKGIAAELLIPDKRQQKELF
jgi:hypothetical protein